MEFSFGEGEYQEGQKHFSGKIILGEHKLYLRGEEGDLAPTYIPLEKIEWIKKKAAAMEIQVRPAMSFRYFAVIKGERQHMTELVNEIVKRRGLKKLFLRNEWKEPL